MEEQENSELIFRLTKKDPKENSISYNIETIQDIYDAVTVENIDKFLHEFGIIIRSVVLAKRLNKDKPMKFKEIVWTDD